MKIKRKLTYIFFSIMLVLTSCTSTNTKNDQSAKVDDKTIDQAAEEILEDNGLINDAVEKPVGEPYEVGVTPDDYNMDYDTSRLLSLDEKKSKYYHILFNPYYLCFLFFFVNLIKKMTDLILNRLV